MNKKELAVLEKAFDAEVRDALRGEGFGLIQTRSKLAVELVEKGMLQKKTVKLGGRFPVTVEGYELTHAGRIAYCETCKDEEEPTGKEA